MSGGPAPAPAGAVPCSLCEIPVTRAPRGERDWQWVDASGSPCGPKTWLFRWRYLPDGTRVEWLPADVSPYQRLAELAALGKASTQAETMEYTALRCWEQMGYLNLHSHHVRPEDDPTPRVEAPPLCCGRVPYLAPVGWLCRATLRPLGHTSVTG